MFTSGTPTITHDATLHLTPEDMTRLRTVVDRYVDGLQAAAAEALELELDSAVLVERSRLPRDTVTMRSRFVIEDVESGRRREATLVYPEEADPAQSRISVLAPAGLAVIGLRVGDVVQWPAPTGKTAAVRILEVISQPEPEGEPRL